MIQIGLELEERDLLLICLYEYLRLVKEDKTYWNPLILPQIQIIVGKIKESE